MRDPAAAAQQEWSRFAQELAALDVQSVDTSEGSTPTSRVPSIPSPSQKSLSIDSTPISSSNSVSTNMADDMLEASAEIFNVVQVETIALAYVLFIISLLQDQWSQVISRQKANFLNVFFYLFVLDDSLNIFRFMILIMVHKLYMFNLKLHQHFLLPFHLLLE
jgi:hypothetical protein